MIPVPQSQKEPTTDSRGVVGSQEWYENYGYGPEHLFLGDRTIKLHDMWGPKHEGLTPPVQQEVEGSWLPAAGVLGLAAYDEWKKRRGEGLDTSQQAFWQDMHGSAANTADTDAWVNQQLDEYGSNAPMPVMNEDGTVSYLEPNKFWGDMHRSAMDTSSTDDWVNQQLEDYRTDMARPVLNDDGTISYVDQEGNPIDSSSEGFTLGRAWQGLGGAYGLYSGLEEGDTEGYIKAAEGVRDLYNAYTGSAGGLGALDIYSGIQEGGVQGYTQAAGGALQAAETLGAQTGALGSTVGKAIPLIGAAFSAYGAYESAKVGEKKGAVAQGAMAGAAVGSVIPVIGTAIGAVVGALVGLVGASLGNKQMASETYYGAHKDLKPEEMIRGWSEDQVNGAVFETIKSHTKSGNINKYQDVAEMYTAFGITKDAHKNYKNVQTQMGDFMKGVIQTAQQTGGLPTDPRELKDLDGQQIYYKIIVPAMAAKYKEATGKDSQGWTVDKVTSGSDSKMHALMADWTDWMTSHWGEAEAKQQQLAELQRSRATSEGDSGLGMGRVGGGRVLERRRGGLATFNEGGMVPKRGGLSMANRPTLGESRSYYRYGAQPGQPQAMQQPPQATPQGMPPMGGRPGMPARPMSPMVQRAMGGLAMYGFSSGGAQQLVRGPGTGRSDDIPAVLSDGEYVMDAETVALLGDGSTDEGARRLDELRKKLRMHKGKQLSRGNFSSAAKNPEEYL